MVRLLAYVTGLVNQRLLLQNEHLIAEMLHSRFESALPQSRIGFSGLSCRSVCD
jgi:hypothetical protein